ncbi:MAG: 2-amino-4-hydroxy-6-hydroxymethyldihydropteridine diphosphokinase, partial [Armatimonadota bacterium]|nr:2-amino-4-hydroxy-6-hydroxymethyldihydropteridine diphosphokinase [Armatimonadota bacterium]
GLGSNLGDRVGYLRAAPGLLTRRGVLVQRVSSLYESAPVGLEAQPLFLNAVAAAQSALPPEEVLRVAMEVEKALGRERQVRWGPRTLDVDLLLYDDRRLVTPELCLPHPRMHQRRFVLLPLLELDPHIEIPGMGPAAQLLAALDAAAQPVWRTGPFPPGWEAVQPSAAVPDTPGEEDGRRPTRG